MHACSQHHATPAPRPATTSDATATAGTGTCPSPDSAAGTAAAARAEAQALCLEVYVAGMRLLLQLEHQLIAAPEGAVDPELVLKVNSLVVRLMREGRFWGLAPARETVGAQAPTASGSASSSSSTSAAGADSGRARGAATANAPRPPGEAADLREWAELMDVLAYGIPMRTDAAGEPTWPAYWRRRFFTQADGSLGQHGVDDDRGRGGYWGPRLSAQDFMDEHLAQTFQDSDRKLRGVPPTPADEEEWAALTDAERTWGLSSPCAALYADLERRRAAMAAEKAAFEARQATEGAVTWGDPFAADAEDTEAGEDADRRGDGDSARGMKEAAVPASADQTDGCPAPPPVIRPSPMPRSRAWEPRAAEVPPPIIVDPPDPAEVAARQKERERLARRPPEHPDDFAPRPRCTIQ